MNHTILLLLAVGLLGVLAQALKKMNELNRRNNGNFNLAEYLRLERFSLLMSVIIVIAATIICQHVDKLANAGDWLLGGQFAMGWFGQSALEAIMGKAAKKIGVK